MQFLRPQPSALGARILTDSNHIGLQLIALARTVRVVVTFTLTVINTLFILLMGGREGGVGRGSPSPIQTASAIGGSHSVRAMQFLKPQPSPVPHTVRPLAAHITLLSTTARITVTAEHFSKGGAGVATPSHSPSHRRLRC